jgi:ribose transport system substrate-binding protein
MSVFRRRYRALIVAAAVLAVSACSAGTAGNTSAKTDGSGDGLSPSIVSELKSLLSASRAPSTFTAPGPAIDTSGLKGKTVFVLADGNNQFTQSFLAGIEGAAKEVGMTVKVGNGNSVTTQDIQVLQNAVTAKVSAIIDLAIQPQLLSTAFKKAKAAGIPVIEAFIDNPRLPTAEEKDLGIVADATYCYACTAKLIAAYELLRTGPKINAYVQHFPGQPASEAVVEGWKDAMAKWCKSGCKTTYQDIPSTANIGPAMQNAAQVAAQNPQTTLLLPVYDYQIAYAEPAVRAAGATSRINIDSENADLAQMQDLANGGNTKVDVGNPVEWDGWGAMDQVFRALLGKAPVVDEKLPVRMFDSTNIAQLDLSKDPATWYGSADYAASYSKLWGVAGS